MKRLDDLKPEARRQDWLAGRMAAKLLLQEYCQIKEAKRIEIAIGRLNEPLALIDHKKLDEISLSISHSHGRGFAGVSHLRSEGRIGVDVEKIRPAHPKLQRRILDQRERNDLKLNFSENSQEGVILYWSLKEAAYKCLRSLINVSKRQIRVHINSSQNSAQIKIPHLNLIWTVEGHYEQDGNFIYSWVLASPDFLYKLSQD
ncbi:4'-phosphopantetheinyl transferase superfamily protein [Candidatus Acetothermia bacterium]|nr:4'-phosphopantetheinyl transferase superfamily protein [Candidatus Acetothermia bacterium]